MNASRERNRLRRELQNALAGRFPCVTVSSQSEIMRREQAGRFAQTFLLLALVSQHEFDHGRVDRAAVDLRLFFPPDRSRIDAAGNLIPRNAGAEYSTV